MTKFLTMEEIAAAPVDLDFAEIDVPKWGGTIRIASLDGELMVKWLEMNNDNAKNSDSGLVLVAWSLVDEFDNRIGTLEHVKMLAKKDAQVMGSLVSRCLTINGLKTAPSVTKND